MSHSRFCFALLLAAGSILSACGGGGDSPPPPPPPPTSTFTLSGNVSGLSGTGLVLQNGSTTTAISANGIFQFTGSLTSGTSYSVSVQTQPSGPVQNCTVANGSGTITANVSNVTVTCTTPVTAADTDADGLSDDDETNLHRTSPNHADTDGDGLDDRLEVERFSATNPYFNNPRIADLPKLRVELMQVPTIGAEFQPTNSVVRTEQTQRGAGQTIATSHAFGSSVTLGVESTSEVTSGFSLEGGFSAEARQSLTLKSEFTASYNFESRRENQSTWSRMAGQEIEESTTTSNGFVRAPIRLVNYGNVPYTISVLRLTATQVSTPTEPFRTFATLTAQGAADGTFSQSLEAGETRSNFLFESRGIDVGTLRELLTSSRSITVSPAVVELTDANGTPVAFQNSDANAVTAKILIDYGVHREAELYQVSARYAPGAVTQSLSTLLTDVLNIPYSSGTGLSTVRAVSPASGGRWIITRQRDTGDEIDRTVYDSVDGAYSLANIDVTARDDISIVLVEDPDGDGIGWREERLHGTDPSNQDTDGDGIADGLEIRNGWQVAAYLAGGTVVGRDPIVYSSPLSDDIDDDDVPDADEKARGLDPNNPDTDSDGGRDDVDFDMPPVTLTFDLKPIVGDSIALPGDNVNSVRILGSLSASAGRRVGSLSIDWGDNSPLDSRPGNGNTTVSLDYFHAYASPGTYTIAVEGVDDGSPSPATLRQRFQVVVTAPIRLVNDYGYADGWRTWVHVREVVDLDQDGFDDVVMMGGSAVFVSRGSATGLTAPVVWSSDWRASDFPSVRRDPRFFVDLDGDANRRPDLLAIDASRRVVQYSLNNGSGFDAPVDWVTDIGWVNGELRNMAVVADANGDGRGDLVIAREGTAAWTIYRNNGPGQAPTAFPLAAPPSAGGYWNSRLVLAADVDADGNDDLVFFTLSLGAPVHNVYVALATGSGGFGAWQMPTGGLPDRMSFSFAPAGYDDIWIDDVDDDGLPDLVMTSFNSGVHVSKNLTTGPGQVAFAATEQWTTDYSSSSYGNIVEAGTAVIERNPRFLADMDGDGYKDFVAFPNSGPRYNLNDLGRGGARAFDVAIRPSTEFASTGTQWYAPMTCPPWYGNGLPCREYFPRMLGDFNGDGYPDLLGFDNTGLIYQLASRVRPAP